MSSEPIAIEAQGLTKIYPAFRTPIERLRQALFRGNGPNRTAFTALDGVSFTLRRGEVLGLVGRNGAGKSTLLQMLCGTLMPSSGQLKVHGRIAALLELGAGFNPEFTGRENIHLYATVLGLSPQEIEQRLPSIVDFSGIGRFIDQPVKTYSSGMYVRLAFSIATSVEPDILIIDEALSVGDGEFARRSFDRIMSLKARGATILFCSHAMFHIEALCSKAIWLDQGKVVLEGHPSQVTPSYQAYLDGAPLEVAVRGGLAAPSAVTKTSHETTDHTSPPPGASSHTPTGHAHLRRLNLSLRRADGTLLPSGPDAPSILSGEEGVVITASFSSDPNMPSPSFAVALHSIDGRIIASAGSWIDRVILNRDTQGNGQVTLEFPHIGLLKGRYTATALLFCERGLHIYDNADHFATFEVRQEDLEQGYFRVPRRWQADLAVPATTTAPADVPR